MRLSPRLNQHASGVVLGVTQIINGLYNPVSLIIISIISTVFFIIIIIIVLSSKLPSYIESFHKSDLTDRMLFIDVQYTISLLRKPILRANIG